MNIPMSELYRQLQSGCQTELNGLVGDLYQELRRVAARRLRGERTDHTLQATALVHEAYLKLSDQAQFDYADRTHFLAIVSRVMRQVLVDHARARATRKRGGDGYGNAEPVPFTTSLEVAGDKGMEQIELLELDRALTGLARYDESLAQLVEMRYFGGMTAEETADALDQSVHVIRHDLRLAQAWLRRELRRGSAH